MNMSKLLSVAVCSLGASIAHASEFCVTPNASIPDNGSTLSVPLFFIASASESVESMSLGLVMEHDWIGDLRITLTSPQGTTITLLDRPGLPSTGFPGPFGCGGRDLDATFIDSATLPAESMCSTSATPVIAGDVIPSMPMDAFAGEIASGTWMLSITDLSPYDTGIVVQACLSITTMIECSGDLTGDGATDFLDISAFLSAYTNGQPLADFNNDHNYDFLDISAFLSAYSAGCP